MTNEVTTSITSIKIPYIRFECHSLNMKKINFFSTYHIGKNLYIRQRCLPN